MAWSVSWQMVAHDSFPVTGPGGRNRDTFLFRTTRKAKPVQPHDALARGSRRCTSRCASDPRFSPYSGQPCSHARREPAARWQLARTPPSPDSRSSPKIAKGDPPGRRPPGAIPFSGAKFLKYLCVRMSVYPLDNNADNGRVKCGV